MEKEKSPEDWALDGWKEALRWFFKTAMANGSIEKNRAEPEEEPVLLEEIENPWEKKLVISVRKNHLMLRTEQAYRGWLKRYLAWLAEADPLDKPKESLENYLEHQTAVEGVAYSTQKQALSALVYFYKRALDIELGELQFTTARFGHRHPHRPGPARTFKSRDNPDLPPCDEKARYRRYQPPRSCSFIEAGSIPLKYWVSQRSGQVFSVVLTNYF